MDVWDTEAWKVSPQSASRRELLRNSLDPVRDQTDAEPKRLARSPKAGDSAQDFDIRQAMSSEGPPPRPATFHGWGHGNASYWL